jgi:hypothetical protein
MAFRINLARAVSWRQLQLHFGYVRIGKTIVLQAVRQSVPMAHEWFPTDDDGPTGTRTETENGIAQDMVFSLHQIHNQESNSSIYM